MAVALGSTGAPSLSYGTPSASYTCRLTGYTTFVNASGSQVVYSATQSSTSTESGRNTGITTRTSILTSGPYTLTISVSS